MNGQVDIITGNVSNRALVKSAVEHFNTAFESPITIGINCAGMDEYSTHLKFIFL